MGRFVDRRWLQSGPSEKAMNVAVGLLDFARSRGERLRLTVFPR